MKSPKVTKKTIEQEIDLGEMFGIDATDSPALKEMLAQAIIDRIVARTEDGKGMRFGSGGSGSEVKLKSPYSKAYQESVQFKAAGKKASEITMELTGDMMASIDVISTKGNKIKIGISDELQVLKAFNHITGDTVPERPFFGVNKNELQEIGRDFSGEFRGLEIADFTTPRQQKLLDLLEAINSSDGGGGVVVTDEIET